MEHENSFEQRRNLRFTDSRLERLELVRVKAPRARFKQVDLRFARLDRVDLRGVVITHAQVEGLIINGRPIGEILAWMEQGGGPGA